MLFSPDTVFSLVLLIIASSIAARVVIGGFRKKEFGRSVGARLTSMEERVQRMEEATSTLVAEFAAVRERERFMTQLVESRIRSDHRTTGESHKSEPKSLDTTSPFVVQTVHAVKR
jgi:hypothetical protein